VLSIIGGGVIGKLIVAGKFEFYARNIIRAGGVVDNRIITG